MDFDTGTQVELPMDPHQRAVVTEHGFVVRDDRGQFQLTDPVVRKITGGRDGRYLGANLDILLSSALNLRSEYKSTEAMEPATKGKKMAKTAKKIGLIEATGADATSLIMGASKTPSDNVPDASTSNVSNTTSSNEHASGDVSDAPAVTTKANKVAVKSKGAKLGNGAETLPSVKMAGKLPVGAKTVTVKADRKPHAYDRAAIVLLADPTTTDAVLAKKAGMSKAMASYCIKAWVAYIKVLRESVR